ncbi:hypothetical protein AB6C60_12540 [Vibrio cyclitrophicus]
MSVVVHNTDFLGDIALDWAGLSTIGMVVSIRQEGDKPTETMQIKHYISSAKLTAKALLESREHIGASKIRCTGN